MTECQHVLQLPQMTWDEEAGHWTVDPTHEFVVTTHVCGLPPAHLHAPEPARRRHLCRSCSLTWGALDHNPFAQKDRAQ